MASRQRADQPAHETGYRERAHACGARAWTRLARGPAALEPDQEPDAERERNAR